MHKDLPMLNQLLIPIGHRIPDHIRESIASGEMMRLTSRRAVMTQAMLQLREHQRRILTALARGQSTNSSFLIGESAGAVHGLWLLQDAQAKVELSTKSGRQPPRSKWPKGCKYRVSKTGAEEIVHVLGAAVLEPVSTWFDIACTNGFEAGLIAADSLLAQGFTPDQLMDKIVEVGQCYGIKWARLSLKHAISESQSAGESLARALLIQAKIGPITPQAQIVYPYSVDLLIGDWVVVEIDGEEKYLEDPVGTTRRERARQKQMERMGYRFLRYTPTEIETDPERFLKEVKEALSRFG